VTFVCALFLEPIWILSPSGTVATAVIYSAVIVAFASYLVWFKLIHVYPVSDLAIFTFLSPVFGVAAGAILLREQLTTGLILGLILVSAGIYVTNRRPKAA
jgi:drug/metabolite transporter (DMT)-like permease